MRLKEEIWPLIQRGFAAYWTTNYCRSARLLVLDPVSFDDLHEAMRTLVSVFNRDESITFHPAFVLVEQADGNTRWYLTPTAEDTVEVLIDKWAKPRSRIDFYG
jgi:hypothetical protein